MRSSRLLGAIALASALLAPAPAFAADDASIDHSEHKDGTLTLLVSVPGTEAIDLDSLDVTIGGEQVTATATPAESSNSIERTAVLAIDTSNSMRGDRIIEAKRAAGTFLLNVPANVRVGIVTFDNTVQVRQEPSTDREASREVLRTLPLRVNTKLYDGVRQAIRTAGGGDGQRQVLLLSDGADNTGAKIDPLIPVVAESGVKLDVVSLQQEDAGNAALQQLAEAGKGTVIDAADPEALSQAFKDEADALARQVVVTATVPDSLKQASTDVAVSLKAGDDEHSTSAFLAVRDAEAKGPVVPKAPTKNDYSLDVPREAVYGGLVAIFLGVIGVVWAFASGSRNPTLSVSDQIAAYGSGADRQKLLKKQSAPTESLKDGARAAAESMLASNKSFEARVANRLEGAGMALKPAEWILLHAGILILCALVGLLAGGGTNVPLLIMFLLIGALAPWFYLSLKRSRRLKAFNEHLADTLQLMSGSLSAGLSLTQSLDTIVREGSEPMTGEFKRVIAETRLGVGLEDALEGVAERMDSKDFRWVIMAIRIQREVGGNLAELLLSVASTLRERQFLRRQVLTLSAEGRLSAYILAGLPPVFLLYLTAAKPGYVGPMFSDPRGWVMLGVMAALLVVGSLWMLKVAKVEV